MKKLIILTLIVCLSLVLSPALYAVAHEYVFDFEHPMSWADDVSPWADYKIQEWEIAEGGHPGKALRINGAAWGRPSSYEIRTLMVNHKPGTSVTVSFDFRAASNPPKAYFMINYFDGYCTGQTFYWASDDLMRPLPKPPFDTRETKVGTDWQRVTFTTPPLNHTVLTLAFHCQQTQDTDDPSKWKYLDYYLDNLNITVTPLDVLMDTDFQWHGNYGSSTVEFRRNFSAADADWCDFADQEIVETPQGNIRYTLFQFRDATRQVLAGTRHQLKHSKHEIGAWGESTVTLARGGGAGNLSAASWGVRQTVSYEALGLQPAQKAKIRVRMRISSIIEQNAACRIQIGVDPYGGVVTRNAVWTPEEQVNIRNDEVSWIYPSIEFNRPKNAQAFTIYFRQRDGLPQDASDTSYPPEPNEPQSQGSASPCESYADWVMVEVLGG